MDASLIRELLRRLDAKALVNHVLWWNNVQLPEGFTPVAPESVLIDDNEFSRRCLAPKFRKEGTIVIFKP